MKNILLVQVRMLAVIMYVDFLATSAHTRSQVLVHLVELEMLQ